MLNITSKTTKKITEAAYLCMENASRYRAIIELHIKNMKK